MQLSTGMVSQAGLINYLNALLDQLESQHQAAMKRLQELDEVWYEDGEWFWKTTGEVVGAHVEL